MKGWRIRITLSGKHADKIEGLKKKKYKNVDLNLQGDKIDDFDEIVVGNFLHIERMDTGYIWMRLGDIDFRFTHDFNGNLKEIRTDERLVQDENNVLNILKQLDSCQRCHGKRGGVPGNENIINNEILCDYCHADLLKKEGAHLD